MRTPKAFNDFTRVKGQGMWWVSGEGKNKTQYTSRRNERQQQQQQRSGRPIVIYLGGVPTVPTCVSVGTNVQGTKSYQQSGQGVLNNK